MVTTYIYGFLSALIISLISLIGVFTISLRQEFSKKYIFIFISLAVGALLGDAFVHLVPEAFASDLNSVSVSFWIILGIVIFFVLEKFLHWHHHGEDTDKPHIHLVGKLVLLSDGVHNLIDGIVIGASFMVSVPLGVATTITVALHEIPQEVGDFMVLLHSGYNRKRALWLNFLSALTAVFGVIIAFILGSLENFIPLILSIVAGGFIYIAVADLIPELHKTKEIKHSAWQILAVIAGVLVMLALAFVG